MRANTGFTTIKARHNITLEKQVNRTTIKAPTLQAQRSKANTKKEKGGKPYTSATSLYLPTVTVSPSGRTLNGPNAALLTPAWLLG